MLKKILIVISAIIIVLISTAIWGFYIEPNILIANRISIQDKELSGIKVVFVSDLHLCKDDESRINRIISKINNENADIVLLGGDYMCADMQGKTTMAPQQIVEHLVKIKGKYGVFTVFGNHDSAFHIIKKMSDLLSKGNITILQNKNTTVQIGEKKICIAGIADFSSGLHKINQTFEGTAKPIVAFTHSPDLFNKIPQNVNILFAGHTHGGQVAIPFWGPLAKPRHLVGKYVKGFYEFEGRKMFVSKGCGNSHINVRFCCIPEIVVATFE